MVQILPNRKGPSFLQSISGGIESGMQSEAQRMMQREASNAELEAKRKLLQEEYGLKGTLEEKKQAAKYSEKLKAYKEFRNEMGGKLRGEQLSEKETTQEKLEDHPPYTQSEIDNALFFDPQIASSFEKQNEEWHRQKRHEEEREEKKVVQQRKEFESDREYHSKMSDPIIKEAQAVIKEAPIKKGLINQQRRDIASGQTEGIIPFLVEKTGSDVYRNPESARFKTASKQRFIESLHSLGAAGARANQFIEQQLVGAQATLGRSAEANQTVLDLEEFVDDLKSQRAKLEMELAEQDRQEFGYARNDISQRADRKMEKYAEQRQDEMAYNIRRRREENMSDEQIVQEMVGNRVTPDTPLTLRTARILMIKNNDNEKKAQAEAKRLGYKIPSEATYLREIR